MKNFKIGVFDGKELWYSRSLAVTLFSFVKEKEGNVFILANQRGKGTQYNQGQWNCSCGYLDFDETAKEAAVRETFEETGVKVDKKLIKFIGFNSNPKDDELQNVTFRYAVILPKDISFYKKEFSKKNNEEDEVSNIKFISLKDLDKYNWAFNHKTLIKKAWSNINEKDELSSLISESNLIQYEQPSLLEDLHYLEVELGITVDIRLIDDGKTIIYAVDTDKFLNDKVDTLDIYTLLTHQWYFEKDILIFKLKK